MARENFSEPTTADLIKKKKQTRFGMGIIIGVFIAIFIIGILKTMDKGFSYFLFIPFAFLPMLFANYKIVSDINKEFKSKNSNG